jgi:acetyl esterase/lipase
MWNCPKCGKRIDNVFDACWKCGTARDGTIAPDFQAERRNSDEPDAESEWGIAQHVGRRFRGCSRFDALPARERKPMKKPKHGYMHLILAVFLLVSASCTPVQTPGVAPTHKDVAYDNAHPAQKLDVYLAKSDKPTAVMVYIHGGGWQAGSKNQVPDWLMNAVREGWLSVVSVEYRFIDVAPHPAQVNDCIRAVQFVRHNAAKWNIDPRRVGVTGGSAGGHLALWVALHDDAANPKSNDPVERQSSRVACAVSFAGPTDWSLLSELEHAHPAFRQLLGYKPGTPADEMDAKAKKDVSPISFVSRDDPPIMQVHGDKDNVVPFKHARTMHERLTNAGVKSELVIIEGADHGVAGANLQVAARAATFVREQLLRP